MPIGTPGAESRERREEKSFRLCEAYCVKMRSHLKYISRMGRLVGEKKERESESERERENTST